MTSTPPLVMPLYIPSEGHVRLNVVLAMTGVSKGTWYRLMRHRDPELRAPQPVSRDPGMTKWDVNDVRAFLVAEKARGQRQASRKRFRRTA